MIPILFFVFFVCNNSFWSYLDTKGVISFSSICWFYEFGCF